MTPRERRIQQARLLREKAVRRSRASLSAFIRYMWPVIDKAHYIHNWHVDAICEHLEAVSAGEIQYLGINIPPGMLKSLSVSVFWPSWEWIACPHLQYQRASHDMALATRDNLKVRDLVKSEVYQRDFSDLAFKRDEDGKTYFVNTEGGSQRAVSPKSSTTGWRSHRLLVDDLLDRKQAHSDTMRAYANDWFARTFLSRRHDEEVDPVVVIAQRLHEDDIFGMFDNELADLEWDWLILPQRYNPTVQIRSSLGYEDPRTEDAELLFPARVSPKQDALNERVLGDTDYAAQQSQDPVPPGGAILKPERIGYYRLTPEEIAARSDIVIISVDCAFKDHDDADFVCAQVFGVIGADVHLLDETMAKLDLTATIDATRELHYKWTPRAKDGIHTILVEDKANGSSVIKTISRELPAVLPINPEGGKVARAHACAPLVDAGNLWMPDPSLGIEYTNPDNPSYTIAVADKRKRYGRFPKLKNDDDIDATTQALNWIRSRPVVWSTF